MINAPQNAEVDENATCDLLQEGEELIRLDSKSTFTSVQSRWHDVPPTDNIEREKNNLDPAVSINAGLSESEGATAGLVTNLFFYLLTFMGVIHLVKTRADCSDGFADHCIFVSPYYYY